MDVYQIKAISEIVLTIAGVVLPALAAWLLKKISDKDRREVVRQTAVHVTKFISELPQVKDNPTLDSMGLVLAKVSEQLNGLSASEEKLVKAVAESIHTDPSQPYQLPRFSPSIQLPQAKIK